MNPTGVFAGRPSICRLWLVRHAQPLVAPGLCYGSTDLPACPHDTARAAHALAPCLPPVPPLPHPSPAPNPPPGARWRVSGLARARQLADAVHALRPGAPTPVVDPRLNEKDFGRFEMTPWDAIDRAAFDAWEADFAGHRFGGGDSVNDLLARVAAALRDVLASDAEDHVWFTHAGVILAVQHWLSQPRAPLAMAHWPRAAPAYGEWRCLEVDRAVLSATLRSWG